MSDAVKLFQSFSDVDEQSELWVLELRDRLGWKNEARTRELMRSTFSALRDRLSKRDADYLGAQMPKAIRDVFHDNWSSECSPCCGDDAAFVEDIRNRYTGDPDDVSIKAASAVFALLGRHVSVDDADETYADIPRKLLELWPTDF